jgi:hypothetical protein
MLQPHSGDALARTCVTKLATFLQDPDQNREFVADRQLDSPDSRPPVKYIALLALTKIVPSHPHLVGEYQKVILSSIDDQDMSIRMRALDLVSAMVLASHTTPRSLGSNVPSLGRRRQPTIYFSAASITSSNTGLCDSSSHSSTFLITARTVTSWRAGSERALWSPCIPTDTRPEDTLDMFTGYLRKCDRLRVVSFGVSRSRIRRLS